MAKKVKTTRPELKRQRNQLKRFNRYLPMLKLKQQQLQVKMREVAAQYRQMQTRYEQAKQAFDAYADVMRDRAGINVEQLATPAKINKKYQNVAGINLPFLEGLDFPEARYSLFGTPAWVDKALADLRSLKECEVERAILQEQYELLSHELTRIMQRVNLFEKVMIPDTKEAIRIIRIKLGDEMTAAVARAKIAKDKLAAKMEATRDADSTAVVAVEGADA